MGEEDNALPADDRTRDRLAKMGEPVVTQESVAGVLRSGAALVL